MDKANTGKYTVHIANGKPVQIATEADATIDMASTLHKNIADENTAVQGYYNMLSNLTDPADKLVINGIIAEELKHIELLNTMLKKYTDLTAEK
jgi:rubrerythrin